MKRVLLGLKCTFHFMHSTNKSCLPFYGRGKCDLRPVLMELFKCSYSWLSYTMS